MKKVIFFSFLMLFFSFYLQAQLAKDINAPVNPSIVIFKYDDSGNQIFRGPEGIVCITCVAGKEPEMVLSDQIANKIQAAPVPVKTDLTVFWDLSIRDFITRIELLPYNAFSITESVSVKTLRTNSYIFKMSHLPYGVYYLRFHLSDGTVYSRTVTKN